MAKTKSQLITENNSNFPNNNSQFITPEKLRGFNSDMIDAVALEANPQFSGTGSFSNLSGSGYVSASEFIGDGSKLTGVTSSVPAGTVSGSSQVILTDTTGNLGGNRITGSVSNATSATLATNATYVNVQPNAINSNYYPSFTNGTGLNTTVYIDTTGYTYNPGQNRLTISNVSATAVTASVSVTSPTFYGDLDGNALTATNATYAQNTITTGKNLHSSEIQKGTPLYFTGSGTSGNLVGVYPADAGNPSRMPAGGIAGETIAVGAEGVVLLDGYIGGVDTTGFLSGQKVYVGVGGGYTVTQPTGSALIQFLGNIEKGNSANGSGVINMMGEARRLPNLQSGYAWVGDGNGVPQAVATSSFAVSVNTGSLVTTSSFNSYTSSNDSKVNSLISATGSYARTDVNNSFSGTQSFVNISVSGTGSFGYIQSVTGSAKIIGDAFIILNNDTPTERYAGIVVQDSGSGSPLTTASFQFDGASNDWFYEYSTDGGVTTDHGVALFGPEYATKGSPTYPTNNQIQKGTGGHHLTGSNITDDGSKVSVNSNTDITGSLTITSTFRGNDILLDDPGANSTLLLNPNYFSEFRGALLQWKEGVGETLFQIAETNPQIQMNGWDGSTYDTSFWIDVNGSGATFSDWNGSYTKTSWLNVPQQGEATFYRTVNVDDSGNGFTSVHGAPLFQTKNNNVGGIGITSNLNTAGVSGYFGPGIYGFTDDSNYYEVIRLQDSGSFTNGDITIIPASTFEGGVIHNNNVTTIGSTTLSTLISSGSVKSEVKSQGISSLTASIDFNTGSMFELTLGSGVDTHIDASNIGKGQTINVLITQDASSAGTVTFSPKFLQPSGSEYTPTTTLSGQDILTLVTFNDTSKIYVANVKNLI